MKNTNATIPSFLLVGFAALLAAAPAARAQYTFTNVADTSSPTYSNFGGSFPSLNAAGTLGFRAQLDAGGQGLFTGDGTTTTTIALTSSPTYAGFGNGPSINTTGTLGFFADLDSGKFGLFTSDGTTTRTIAVSNGPIYNSVGSNTGGTHSINAAGTLGFRASPLAGGDGLYISDGTTTTTVALTSGPPYFFLGSPVMNAAGTLGFYADLDAGGTGLFTGNGTTTTTIALSSGTPYANFANVPSINAAGRLGFYADLDSGGTGLFTSDGTTTTTIALRGLTYSNFGSRTSLNTAGTLGFSATLDAGGFGLFTGDGTTTTEVITTGDALFGSTVTGLNIGREALNDAGQLAFQYTLADGRNGVALATLILAVDYNQNGKVDAADYVLWRKSPDTYGGNPAGYNTWRANFGQPAGSGSGTAASASAAVPEPTTAVTLMFSAAVWCLRRRREA